MGQFESRTEEQKYFCFICGGPGSTRHHLVPKSFVPRGFLNGHAMIRLCPNCHAEVHFYFSNYDLAIHFNTAEKLKNELVRRKEQFKPALAALLTQGKVRQRKKTLLRIDPATAALFGE
jgi:hypothetical protein